MAAPSPRNRTPGAAGLLASPAAWASDSSEAASLADADGTTDKAVTTRRPGTNEASRVGSQRCIRAASAPSQAAAADWPSPGQHPCSASAQRLAITGPAAHSPHEAALASMQRVPPMSKKDSCAHPPSSAALRWVQSPLSDGAFTTAVPTSEVSTARLGGSPSQPDSSCRPNTHRRVVRVAVAAWAAAQLACSARRAPPRDGARRSGTPSRTHPPWITR